jgi:hypothetical protein
MPVDLVKRPSISVTPHVKRPRISLVKTPR